MPILQNASARFRAGDGSSMQGQEMIIPICAFHESGKIECIGTGFLIATGGIFVTAAHVVRAITGEDNTQSTDAEGNPAAGLFTVQFIPPDKFVRREVQKVCVHMVDDLAIGTLKPIVHPETKLPLENKVLTLTKHRPAIGHKITTWAYPNCITEYGQGSLSIMIVPTICDGVIEDEFPDGRGWGKTPGRCYQTNLGLAGGASGGPVFDEFGNVFAVNSSGFDGTDIAYVSHIQSIGGLPLPKVQTPDGVMHENIRISELISAGLIKVIDPNEER